MKHKVSELAGLELDLAVARAEGLTMEYANVGVGWVVIIPGRGAHFIGTPAVKDRRYAPSEDWAQGGPIIERERIELMFGDQEDPGQWSAYIKPPSHAEYRAYLRQGGAAALVAAMRAYVASKFGETVELP